MNCCINIPSQRHPADYHGCHEWAFSEITSLDLLAAFAADLIDDLLSGGRSPMLLADLCELRQAMFERAMAAAA